MESTKGNNNAGALPQKEETTMKEITLTLTETQLHCLKAAVSNMADLADNPVTEEALDDIYNQIEKAEA